MNDPIGKWLLVGTSLTTLILTGVVIKLLREIEKVQIACATRFKAQYEREPKAERWQREWM